MRRNLVVMGGSAGGVDALRAILGALPADFPAAVCAVVHISPHSPGILDRILDRAGPLPAVAVTLRERLRPGRIYVPAPDRHLIVEPSMLRATRGPKENRFRPAIDPLFRSAAQTYGPRVIGVIVSGGLDDGTAGLRAVKQLGGVAIVQDPEEALVPSMPLNARAQVAVDHCVALAEIPALLVALTSEDLVEAGGYPVPDPIRMEVEIAAEAPAPGTGIERFAKPSRYACPECHGVLMQLQEGGRIRFRCHTGHAYSAQTLIADMDQAIEDSLWNSIRALQEKTLLVRHLEEHARAENDEQTAERLQRLARHAEVRADLLRQTVLQAEIEPADNLPSTSSS